MSHEARKSPHGFWLQAFGVHSKPPKLLLKAGARPLRRGRNRPAQPVPQRFRRRSCAPALRSPPSLRKGNVRAGRARPQFLRGFLEGGLAIIGHARQRGGVALIAPLPDARVGKPLLLVPIGRSAVELAVSAAVISAFTQRDQAGFVIAEAGQLPGHARRTCLRVKSSFEPLHPEDLFERGGRRCRCRLPWRWSRNTGRAASA